MIYGATSQSVTRSTVLPRSQIEPPDNLSVSESGLSGYLTGCSHLFTQSIDHDGRSIRHGSTDGKGRDDPAPAPFSGESRGDARHSARIPAGNVRVGDVHGLVSGKTPADAVRHRSVPVLIVPVYYRKTSPGTARRAPWLQVYEPATGELISLDAYLWRRGDGKQPMRALDLVREQLGLCRDRRALEAKARNLAPLVRHYLDSKDQPAATEAYLQRLRAVEGNTDES